MTAIDPTADDVVNLGDDLGTGAPLRLECSKCHGGNDEAPGGALTVPVRYDDDPDTVVRCASCGKKHSEASLTLDTGGGR